MCDCTSFHCIVAVPLNELAFLLLQDYYHSLLIFNVSKIYLLPCVCVNIVFATDFVRCLEMVGLSSRISIDDCYVLTLGEGREGGEKDAYLVQNQI